MTYEEFTKQYESLLTEMLKYNIEQVGSGHFASKLADLTEAYPAYEAQYDDQH